MNSKTSRMVSVATAMLKAEDMAMVDKGTKHMGTGVLEIMRSLTTIFNRVASLEMIVAEPSNATWACTFSVGKTRQSKAQ